MAQLPRHEQEIADKIYAAIEKENDRPPYLTRIGASAIGEECLLSLWYGWRGFSNKKHSGRMLRLFNTGHLQETRVIEDLRKAGYSVWDLDDNGKQFTYTDSTGHFVVKLDGVIKGVPGAEKSAHVLEIKSHNKKSFDDLFKKGVKEAKPMHYYQMQAGMLYSNIDRALYVSICKDDEAYYVERIHPDEATQEDIKSRIQTLLDAIIPPVGISDDGKNWACKWCDHLKLCTKEAEPEKTCRSCSYSDPSTGGWACRLKGIHLSSNDQLKACDDYYRY